MHLSRRDPPPRVLFIRNSRGITDITGAETYLLTILSGLLDAGVEVRLICADIDAKGDTAWQAALRDRNIPHDIVNVPKTWSLGDQRAVLDSVRNFQPDVLHAMDHRSDAVAVWVAARTGIPAVASFFGWTNWPKTSLRGRLYPIFDRAVMKRMKKIIVDSEYVGTQIRSASPGAQISVIRNGVDLAKFDPDSLSQDYKTRWFGRDDVTVVGMIGRVHPNKGHMDALDAATDLVARHPDLRFVVLGDPPPGFEDHAAALDAAITDRGLREHFKVTNVPSPEIPRAIASFDITAIPSYMESLSYVMLESMAMRTPVISADVGGHAGVIGDGARGLLFNSGDIATLTRHIDTLVKDPAMRHRQGVAGRAYIEAEYSTQAMVARTTAVYREVVNA